MRSSRAAPRLVAAIALALFAIGFVSLRAPRLYAALLAVYNDPKRLPALAADPRVHYQPGAEACARDAAALLPDAMARVARVQGREFLTSPLIAVYESFDDYARANGLNDAGVAATERGGVAILSPTLCNDERPRLAGVLTHELSHLHLFRWRSSLSPRPPSWFTEGLATMVAQGGGAEGMTDDDARAAVAQGFAIAIADTGLWTDFATIPFEREPPQTGSPEEFIAFRQRLAFREAALFLAWLRQSDAQAFALLLNRLEDGDDFGAAFRKAYAKGPTDAWRDYRAALASLR